MVIQTHAHGGGGGNVGFFLFFPKQSSNLKV